MKYPNIVCVPFVAGKTLAVGTVDVLQRACLSEVLVPKHDSGMIAFAKKKKRLS